MNLGVSTNVLTKVWLCFDLISTLWSFLGSHGFHRDRSPQRTFNILPSLGVKVKNFFSTFSNYLLAPHVWQLGYCIILLPLLSIGIRNFFQISSIKLQLRYSTKKAPCTGAEWWLHRESNSGYRRERAVSWPLDHGATSELHTQLVFLNRQRPTFPGSPPPSIIGAEELNYCVRDGNRCILFAIVTRLHIIPF